MGSFKTHGPGLALSLVLALGLGCNREPGQPGSAGKVAQEKAGSPDAKHEHTPPHGGVPVVLGDEAYHLEFLLDSSAGNLQAYVLDGHMENFIRIGAASIEIEVTLPGGSSRINLAAVEGASTGEKSGDTSLFSGTNSVLKGMTQFDAKVNRIEIRSRIFENVRFHYPKGNE